MAAKKKGKKQAARTDRVSTKKITLPAFGLAEDILGALASDAGPQQDPEKDMVSVPVREEARAVQPWKARDTAVSAPAEDLHLVTFHLDTEEYAVDIGRVQEIIRVGQMTPVPNAPEFIRGVINLRGRIIPVLDLRKRLALAEVALTKHSRIMVVETGTKVLGLLVDRVSQVIKLPQSSVDASPEEFDESRGFVRAIGKIESRLIMIVELDRVLAKDARQAAALQPPTD